VLLQDLEIQLDLADLWVLFLPEYLVYLADLWVLFLPEYPEVPEDLWVRSNLEYLEDLEDLWVLVLQIVLMQGSHSALR
jgi:hypothetical protein